MSAAAHARTPGAAEARDRELEQLAKARQRAEDLIRLSSSPSRGEAENAAVRACALIREHGFELQAPRGRPTSLLEASARIVDEIAKGKATPAEVGNLVRELLQVVERMPYGRDHRAVLRGGVVAIVRAVRILADVEHMMREGHR